MERWVKWLKRPHTPWYQHFVHDCWLVGLAGAAGAVPTAAERHVVRSSVLLVPGTVQRGQSYPHCANLNRLTACSWLCCAGLVCVAGRALQSIAGVWVTALLCNLKSTTCRPYVRLCEKQVGIAVLWAQ